MKKSMKKVTSLMMATAMTAGLLAGCGGGSESADTSGSGAAASGGGDVQISLLNSKGEIQTALEEMAEAYGEATGVELEIIACGSGESPYTRITSMYNSGTAPTMAILDTTDVIALGEEYAVDLSGENWVQYCEDKVTKINDKIFSFPFCIEGRGIIYNKAAIEEALGKEWDPNSVNSLESFQAICEELRQAGMENPVVVSKEDWSVGAHQLGFIYDAYDGTTAGSEEIINALKDGSQKAIDYDRFNQFVDSFDVMLEYNINKADPVGAIYEQDPMYIVDHEAAFWLTGCWAWPNLVDAGADEADGWGFIPWVLGNDTSDFANNGIQAAASKQLMVDKKQASEEQQQAALDFINWLVDDEVGQTMLVENCAIIPACSNNNVEPLDPLGQDIKAKMAEGKTYASSFIAPGDHWSKLGAEVQKYMAGQSTREDLAAAIDAYWQSQK